MTYSLEDTIKFENPKKSPYNLRILKKIPYNVSSVLLLSVLLLSVLLLSVLLLSVLPNDHNRDIAGRNWVKHWYAEYLRIILIY